MSRTPSKRKQFEVWKGLSIEAEQHCHKIPELPDDVWNALSARQLSAVEELLYKTYETGRAEAKADAFA